MILSNLEYVNRIQLLQSGGCILSGNDVIPLDGAIIRVPTVFSCIETAIGNLRWPHIRYSLFLEISWLILQSMLGTQLLYEAIYRFPYGSFNATKNSRNPDNSTI